MARLVTTCLVLPWVIALAGCAQAENGELEGGEGGASGTAGTSGGAMSGAGAPAGGSSGSLGAGGTAGEPAQCSGEQRLCDGACVVLDASNEHCGACNNGCVLPETCVSGICFDVGGGSGGAASGGAGGSGGSASGAGGTSSTVNCEEAMATDLGGSYTETATTADSCLKITDFSEYYGKVDIETTQQAAGAVPFAWQQSCTATGGSLTFQQAYVPVSLTGATNGCTILLELNGSSAALSLRWRH